MDKGKCQIITRYIMIPMEHLTLVEYPITVERLILLGHLLDHRRCDWKDHLAPCPQPQQQKNGQRHRGTRFGVHDEV